MTFQSLPDNDKELVSVIHHLLLANWVQAASLAWISFQAHGRGAVILDFRPFDSPPDELPFAGYAREQDVNPDDMGLAELHTMLETYQPDQEVIFFIYTPLGDTVIEKLSAFAGRPTPPKAADQQQAE
ncbi:MAG: hypothetical protein AAF629_26725 [Chloroflexota bacterium]